MSTFRTCANCGRTTISRKAWAAKREKRVEWKQAGFRPEIGRKLCQTCYARLRRAGGLDTFATKEHATDCSAPECARPHSAHGYCDMHHKRMLAHGSPELPTRTDEDRFWPRVDRSRGDDACWEWRGGRRPDGYGLFYFDGRARGAHRYAHLLLIGPIPAEYEVDHLCRNRGCVNPSHLEAVPAAINNYRSNSWAGVHSRKTHCIHGHPFDEENTYRPPSGGRQCRACRRNRRRATAGVAA